METNKFNGCYTTKDGIVKVYRDGKVIDVFPDKKSAKDAGYCTESADGLDEYVKDVTSALVNTYGYHQNEAEQLVDFYYWLLKEDFGKGVPTKNCAFELDGIHNRVKSSESRSTETATASSELAELELLTPAEYRSLVRYIRNNDPYFDDDALYSVLDGGMELTDYLDESDIAMYITDWGYKNESHKVHEADDRKELMDAIEGLTSTYGKVVKSAGSEWVEVRLNLDTQSNIGEYRRIRRGLQGLAHKYDTNIELLTAEWINK